MLTGTIFITSNDEIVLNEDCVTQLTRIVSLDEDNVLPESPAIIGGTNLLPPIDAKIAEADGNEPLYDEIYIKHLLAPYQQQYMAALLTFLYIGGKLIMFLPSVGYDNTEKKLLMNLYNLYGIRVGQIDSKDPNQQLCFYNMNHIPQWLDLMYTYTNQINPYEYLIKYPYNNPISDIVMNKLLIDLNPYGVSIEEKKNVIKELRTQLQINRNIKLPVEGVNQNVNVWN